MKSNCNNCGGFTVVPTTIPCPTCVSGGKNELDELRALAGWIERNFSHRTKPPEDGVELLRRVRLSQGLKKWTLYKP